MTQPQAIFKLDRDHYGQDSQKRETTLGCLFDHCSDLFGYTLEDVVRAYGIKSKKYTAIPATAEDFTYKLRVMTSPKYGQVVTIFTHIEKDKDGLDVPVLEYCGIRFEWIRAHGGNDADDTEGCLLVASTRVTEFGKMAIQGSLKDKFANTVQALENQGYDVRLKINNYPQAS